MACFIGRNRGVAHVGIFNRGTGWVALCGDLRGGGVTKIADLWWNRGSGNAELLDRPLCTDCTKAARDIGLAITEREGATP